MITIDSSSQDEPQLSSDFAERVMLQATMIIARRRRMRRVAVGGVTSVLAVAAIFAVLQVTLGPSSTNPAARVQSVEYIASPDMEFTSPSTEYEQAGLLDFFFPNADAVARLADGEFAQTYGGEDDTDGVISGRHILRGEYAELDADDLQSDAALVRLEAAEFSR